MRERVCCKKVLVYSLCVGFQFAKESLFFYQFVRAVREVPFNITHSRSEIEWAGLLKCLATGSPLLLSRRLFCDCSYGV